MKRIIPILILASLIFSCSNIKNKEASEELSVLRTQLDSLKSSRTANDMTRQIKTFLTFQKEDAEDAMNFYVRLFNNSRIIDIKRWGKEESGKEGTIMLATFSLNGNLFMCSDSPPIHDWDFTPGVSNWVDCKSDEEIERLYSELSVDANVIFPLDSYSFSPKFAFLEDKFGVSWQLNLN